MAGIGPVAVKKRHPNRRTRASRPNDLHGDLPGVLREISELLSMQGERNWHRLVSDARSRLDTVHGLAALRTTLSGMADLYLRDDAARARLAALSSRAWLLSQSEAARARSTSTASLAAVSGLRSTAGIQTASMPPATDVPRLLVPDHLEAARILRSMTWLWSGIAAVALWSALLLDGEASLRWALAIVPSLLALVLGLVARGARKRRRWARTAEGTLGMLLFTLNPWSVFGDLADSTARDWDVQPRTGDLTAGFPKQPSSPST